MLFNLSNLNSNLALTMGYLNPALNNSALVVSVGRAGGHGLEHLPDQHSGSLNNLEVSATFVMTSANG